MHYIYMLESGWVWRILVIDCEQEYVITPLNFTPFCCVYWIHADGANRTLVGKNISEVEKEDGQEEKDWCVNMEWLGHLSCLLVWRG